MPTEASYHASVLTNVTNLSMFFRWLKNREKSVCEKGRQGERERERTVLRSFYLFFHSLLTGQSYEKFFVYDVDRISVMYLKCVTFSQDVNIVGMEMKILEFKKSLSF